MIYGYDVPYTKTANINSLSQRRSELCQSFFNKPYLILTISYFIYFHLTTIILFATPMCKTNRFSNTFSATGFMTLNKPYLFI